MATDNFDFDFNLTVTPKDKQPEIAPTEQLVQQVKEEMAEHGEPIFDISKFPVTSRTKLDEIRYREKMNGKKKITSYVIGRVRIVYDGESYKAELRNTMHGDGLAYWKKLYEKEIAYARAICYANHLIETGNYGQIPPKECEEYLTINEARSLQLQEAMRFIELS